MVSGVVRLFRAVVRTRAIFPAKLGFWNSSFSKIVLCCRIFLLRFQIKSYLGLFLFVYYVCKHEQLSFVMYFVYVTLLRSIFVAYATFSDTKPLRVCVFLHFSRYKRLSK